jgi:Na+-driven multidrug efflux pump
MTRIAKARGEKRPHDAAAWGWHGVFGALIVMAVIAAAYLGGAELIVSRFINTQSDAYAIAVASLRVLALSLPFYGAGSVLGFCMIASERPKLSLAVSATCQWALFLPLSYWLGPVHGFGVPAIMCGEIAYRSLHFATLALLWRRVYRNTAVETAPGMDVGRRESNEASPRVR